MSVITQFPVRLRIADREALVAHFLALDAEDRRLRFGAPLPDERLREMVESIPFERDELFAVADNRMRLLGVVHVALGSGPAELGLSVLPEARGKGIGNALFTRAVMHLRNRGAKEVFVHCLSENTTMMHLAHKHGMRIEYAGSESDAFLRLERPSTDSVLSEWLHDKQADSMHAWKRHAHFTRSLWSILTRAREALALSRQQL
jgi:ribosomal protein S18 acetylase RimI-like enzyme